MRVVVEAIGDGGFYRQANLALQEKSLFAENTHASVAVAVTVINHQLLHELHALQRTQVQEMFFFTDQALPDQIVY